MTLDGLQLVLARQLSQQTQLPLQRLTQEQMAQVQKHLQAAPGYHLGASQVSTDALCSWPAHEMPRLILGCRVPSRPLQRTGRLAEECCSGTVGPGCCTQRRWGLHRLTQQQMVLQGWEGAPDARSSQGFPGFGVVDSQGQILAQQQDFSRQPHVTTLQVTVH